MDPVSVKSVRQLKMDLASRGVDFATCREKCELQHLLRQALSREPDEWIAVEGFATHKPTGQLCWVEKCTSRGQCWCHWDDGSSSGGSSSDLAPLQQASLPKPSVSEGSFEMARAEAFVAGRLLVAVVLSTQSSKAESLLRLVLASEELRSLLQENSMVWIGQKGDLREPHMQQLAPGGTPSLAMVLPLAKDAMRVLSVTPSSDKDSIISAFVDALEEFSAHREAAEARLVSEERLLRIQQEEEFAESLAADQAAEKRRRCDTACSTRMEESSGDSSSMDGSASLHEAEAEGMELQRERQALAEEFLEAPAPTGPVTRLMLRLPTGERAQRTFAVETPLSRIYAWVQCCALLPEAKGRALQIPAKFSLSTSFPPRPLRGDLKEKTLAELELVPSAALLVVDEVDD